MSEAAQQVTTPTIGDMNAMLTSAGINCRLDNASASIVKAKLDRATFMDALRRAGRGEANAKRWLEINLGKLDLIQAPSANVPTPRRQEEDQTAANDEAGAKRIYLNHHVYGTSALCFSIDETRDGFPTIRLEAANASEGKSKDWANKVGIQLTKAEFPVVTSLLLGYRDSCEFSAHGEAKDKGFKMTRQNDKIYCEVHAKGRSIGVPIPYSDRVHVLALFIRQFRVAYPWLDAGSIALITR